jgi:predicted dehydrogenase
MIDKTIQWGILGCGKIAHKFAHDALLCEGSLLVACASTDRDRSDDFARQFHIPHSYDNYAALYNDVHVDAIYIATPHSFHFENTLACIKAGKHVLCEKPIAINTSQLEILIAAAKENRVFLMEAMWTAFLPMMSELKDLILADTIGQIRFIKADFGFLSPFEPTHRMYNMDLGGGALLDIGIYPIYMATALMGKPITIQSSMYKSPTSSDASTAITLTYEDGTIASLFSTVEADTSNTCEVFGTLGKIEIPARFHEQENIHITFSDGTKETKHLQRHGFGYSHEILHFNECLRTGRLESPIMSHHVSLLLCSIMDEVRKQHSMKYPNEN